MTVRLLHSCARPASFQKKGRQGEFLNEMAGTRPAMTQGGSASVITELVPVIPFRRVRSTRLWHDLLRNSGKPDFR